MLRWRFFTFGAPVGLAAGIFFSGCAASLHGSQDISAAPVSFEQKFEEAKVETVPDDNGDYTTRSSESPRLESQLLTLALGRDVKPPPAPSKVKKGKKGAAPTVVESPRAAPKTWTPRRWPFGIGEKIVLVLRYGPLEGGVATMEVLDPKKIDGQTVLHFRAHVKSSKVLELFYKVDDTMDSWVGIEDHLPRRQEIKQLESGRWGRRVVLYDNERQVAKFYSNTHFPDGRLEEVTRDDPMAPFAQDVFGALYFYRFAQESLRINFPIHDRYRNWANELTFLGKERVQVPAGEFDTLHFKMFPRVSGQLEPKGDVEIWVKDDPSRVLVQFKAKIKVGSVTGELKEFVPGKIPLASLPVMRTPIDLPSGGQ